MTEWPSEEEAKSKEEGLKRRKKKKNKKARKTARRMVEAAGKEILKKSRCADDGNLVLQKEEENNSARKAAKEARENPGKICTDKFGPLADRLVCVNDCIEKIAEPGVPSWIVAGGYNYDSLVESLGERLSMFEAKCNFAKYYDVEYDDVDEFQARSLPLETRSKTEWQREQ